MHWLARHFIRLSPGEQFVGDHSYAYTSLAVSMSRRASLGLFGRHVLQRADDLAGVGVVQRFLIRQVVRAEHPRDAERGNFSARRRPW